MFTELGKRSVRWAALEVDGYQGKGICHVDIDDRAGDVVARGMAIGSLEGAAFAARFDLRCDDSWRSRHLLVEATDGRRLELRSNGEGKWLDEAGEPVPHLDGAVDVDLQASPLTNTLPIRRLGLTRENGPVELAMVYIPFSSFRPVLHRQRYTCLQEGRLYRYENADGSFTADLEIDASGLVLDYPGLFRRLR